MQYIGIDMSKDTFHAALDEQTVIVFKNNLGGIKSFIETLSKRIDTIIGVESTGVYHLLFCSTLISKRFKVLVINPLLTHRMIDSTLRRVKTDKADALTIRKAVISGSGYLFTDSSEMLALKTLVQQRQALCKMRAQTKQLVHAQMTRQCAIKVKLPTYDGILRTLSKEISNLEQKMADYLPDTQTLLRSIPGIGKVSSATLLAHIGDIHRFSSPEKLTAYIGLDPRVHQSGSSINGKGYITKRGNSYLRYILFNAAFIARQRIPELKRYFDKKINEGKHYFNASCAVERKLVHLVYAVWSRGTPYLVR